MFAAETFQVRKLYNEVQYSDHFEPLESSSHKFEPSKNIVH